VIRDLDLSVHSGEVVALLGPNGAGKTTTLRAISGLVRPTSGRVEFAGHDLAARSAGARARMGIAHVPAGRAVFAGLTVREHFRLAAGGGRLDEDMAYDLFPPLRALRNRRAGLLSGGEQQMLAVGRVLAHRPRLLLLDELTLGLAPALVRRLLPVIRRHAAESGCAVLLVEQQVPVALEVVDRAYVLSRGTVVGHGPAAALRADPTLLMTSYLGGGPPGKQ
jgi:branched-chain amino acid transport system ATP-binding protein